MDTRTIILENQNLIYKLANSFNSKNIDDLFQAGCLGVVKAYRNFNESFNTKFSTYAYPYIVGEMKKLMREDSPIKINIQTRKLNLMIEKANILLSQKLMRSPTTFELASYLEVDEYLIGQALMARQSVDSIDKPIIEDKTLHEVIPDKKTDIDELIMLKDELLRLNEEEMRIIQKRYFEDQTQSEVAGALNMTQVQVSRSEQKILTKLKAKLTV
ncbi:MAG: sigma-70 family RNA polymerase sigma factor [Mycoplasmatota bacterium]